VSTAVCTLDPFSRLAPTQSPMPALGRRAQWAAVKDRRRGLFVPALTEAQRGSEVVDHRLKDPGRDPSACLLVDGLPRRKIVGQHPPRSSRTHNPPNVLDRDPLSYFQTVSSPKFSECLFYAVE